ncbi:cadherin repeat domain-containing protein [Bathymodiolus thermophilus thioautotrophic gill symbiont]|uniref:Cadherin domain-containing protein n=1 Tax=Bathymodiolus thermophilus thioautotrophic gill symbiont TaxID=2360 RepID=A0A1J5U8E8_9GAMM|nr:cadherin repeat domain-containing protein [Bathymodiolus thermophilus thioautotrophic gill symbiont]OIR25134.1 hypothetical protein BGC33_15055 [Bathymodiolus thermophilus thioautotrophic gill symbiont]
MTIFNRFIVSTCLLMLSAQAFSTESALTITSTNTLTVNEATNFHHTLTASDTNATFSIIGGNHLFSLSGNNDATLNFRGVETDFDKGIKSYVVKVKASTGTTIARNAEQTITITIIDVNDETPTDITISDNKVKESDYWIVSIDPEKSLHDINHFLVGNFGAIDADANDTFHYSLTEDAGVFLIYGTELRAVSLIDYETSESKNIKIVVKVTDGAGHTFSKEFIIDIINDNDTPPTNLVLNTYTIMAGTLANTQIATASAYDPDSEILEYYIITGIEGNGRNDDFASFAMTKDGKFSITEDAISSGDPENPKIYKVIIVVKDGIHEQFEYLRLPVISYLSITSSNIFTADEGVSTNYTLTANDIAATFSIEDDSSGLFSLSGSHNQILSFNATNLSFENNTNSYTVKVKASAGTRNTEQTITFSLSDVNEAPTDIALSSVTVIENTTTVGTLTNTDDALGTETYSLISGFGDNASFSITGATLSLNAVADYESKTSYSIKVRATDGNLFFDKAFTITITDVNDTAPNNIVLSATIINNGTKSGTIIALLSATDVDTVGTLIYTLSGDDASSFSINGNQLKMAQDVTYSTKSNYSINITANDGINTSAVTAFTLNVAAANLNPANITNTNVVRDEGSALTALTITATNEPNDQTLTYEISGTDAGLFNLNGNIVTFKTAPDYEAPSDNDSNNIYDLVLKVNDTVSTTLKAITITVENVIEGDLTIADQSRSVKENSSVNVAVGTPLVTTGEVTTFTIDAGNSDGFFTINNTGQIQVAKIGLDYETKKSYLLTVKISNSSAEYKTAKITITINDINDVAPTNIDLTRKNIASNATAGAIVGTLSATDTDTDDNSLTYYVDDATNFEIMGNQLKIKVDATAITFPATITITVSDNAFPPTKDFTITKTTIEPDTVPVINQFIVTQGENNGRIISKAGGTVAINALVTAETYNWSSSDIADTSNDTIFSFDPSSIDTGILTIKLKAETNNHLSERVLKLKLIAGNINSENNDNDSDGIPDNKDTNAESNKIRAGEGKTITSSADTKILLGTMGEDSGQLTPDQIRQYLVANNLTNNANDTLTTGDIYDYVVEGLSAVGDSTQVTIELTTAIPKDAELRKYSLTSGWSNFVVNGNNVQSKISTGNACTDDSTTWQTGLITNATCLKLTIKDGGANDTDSDQANGVVESTVSIATPIVIDDNGGNNDDSSSSSGGGCVYNPNAPARFDMGFILLMTLGTYYLIRRRRRFIR